MNNNRRKFIKSSLSLGAMGMMLPSQITASVAKPEPNISTQILKPEVLFFDINETILDLEPLKKSVNTLLKSNDLGTLWFSTMLQYSFVTSLSNQYFDFGKIGVSALQMVADTNNINITEEQAQNVVKHILNLKPHPDVKEGLQLLKNAGYKMVSFTNSSNFGVQQQLKNASINEFFDDSISVEDFGKFKPDMNVYQWAARKMKTPNNKCLLVAAHGWDIAGALWADWQGAFLRRPGQTLFPLAPKPHFDKANLLELAQELVGLK
ncbi:haloacid dehalogenase type II [Flavobacterium aquidurense]|uniref:2-haloacid dehalogenase n=2 Tax=Flavobacterium TaxID=237 RepID=A0A7W7IX39_9FLAO|nr:MULTISPECIES: haloacid dehalogenase type II [Flavobacterium]MBB4801732.1 2-haloacid dehalogenase [Flavobacterium nitrogenifigens]MBB6386690.1 2-haloacid dehalogenase [Flavobacterium notoginsengisoli]